MDTGGDSATRYYEKHCESIELELGDAVDSAIEHEAKDPMLHVAQAILRKRDIRVPGISEVPTHGQLDFKWAVKQVLEDQNERGDAGAGGSAQPAAFPWRAKNWLESLDIIDIIADALLEPLKAEARDTMVLEEEYIKALGLHTTSHPIVNLIEQSVQRLGTAIHKAAKRHARKGFAADNMCLGNQTTSKFFEAQSGTESGAGLQYGDVSHFSMGLDGFLGPPNPLLRDSMAAEHCDSSDSGTPFKVKNYGTVTTPQLEYYFVVDPSDERLHSLGYATWPNEPDLASQEAQSVDPEGKQEVRRKQRRALPMKEFESKLAKVNGKLRDKSVEPLQDEEFHGSRLYTGPMFQKYNDVLREVGKVRTESKSYLSATEIEDKVGNMYTTTIHVINSAIIKLAKLTKASFVYRGISDKLLPRRLHDKDDIDVRGGVEFGFLSCSTKKAEALRYAKIGQTGKPILFEMKMGMIDRGADFEWLSQYPQEKEVLFSPLSGVEVLSHRLEEDVLVLSVRPSVNLHALPIEQVVAKMKASHLQLLDLLTGDLKFAGVPTGALTPLTSFKVQADQQAADAFNSTHKYRDATNQALERQAEVFKLLADPREAFCEKMESRKVRKTALICARAGEHKMAIRLLLEASKKAADELEASKKAADEERTRQGGASGVAPDATDGKLVVSAPRLGDNGRPQGPTHSGSVMRHHLRPIARPPEMTDDEKDAHPGAAELYQIACTMIEEGLPQPWPATFVALGPDSAPEHAHSRRGGELGGGGPPSPGRAVIEEPTRLPKALFKKLVQHIVKEQQPFQVGAKVLCKKDKAYERWENATIRSIEVNGGSHTTYTLESWREMRGIPQVAVLATDGGMGAGAVLRNVCELGKQELAQILLDCSIDLWQADLKGNTALILAASNGHDAVCKLLLEACPSSEQKAFQDLRNRLRQSAYDLAVGARHGKVIRLLTPSDSDQDIDAADVRTFQEHVAAAERSDTPIMDQLRDWKPKNGVTALMIACRLKQPPILIDKLLGVGKAANSEMVKKSKSGCTALTIAAEEGHTEVLKHLLNRGAAPDECTNGRTALSFACMGGHADAVNLLLQCNADVNKLREKMKPDKVTGKMENEDRRTALMIACQFGQADIAELLLKKAHPLNEDGALNTANVNALNFRDESALTFASRYGHDDAVKVLLENHIDLDQEIEDPFWTSLHRAAANGHTGTARLLLRHYRNQHTSSKGRLQLLINHKSKNGTTALMAAASSNHATVVAMLLEEDANIDAVDQNERTALFLAANIGQRRAVSQLLRYNSLPSRSAEAQDKGLLNKRDENGLTPLMAACQIGHDGVVRALLVARADVTIECPQDHAHATSTGGHADTPRKTNALSIAVQLQNATLVNLLVAEGEIPMHMIEDARATAREKGLEEIVKMLHPDRLKNFQRTPTEKAVLRAFSAANVVVELDANLKPDVIAESFRKLEFQKLFSGVLVPPRPTAAQLAKQRTPGGGLTCHGGVVMQRGPFDSIWLRAGCVPNVHWHQLWQTLQAYVSHHLQVQRDRAAHDETPSPIYVAISQRCMQAIDFTWLSNENFVFHHYRRPGHGDACDADEEASAAASPRRLTRADTVWAMRSNAEFVYYCWPGTDGTGGPSDRVPVYGTSIEGATGVLFSTNEEQVLLVWERGAWSTPGGAVNAGECMFEALVREVREEVDAKVDKSWGAYYLGGWQQGRARDNLVNDNFAAFAVRLASDEYTVDQKEINEARFFPWRPLLEAWRAQGKPEPFLVPADAIALATPLPPARQKVNDNLLRWLDTYDSGKALKCKIKEKEQAKIPFMKLTIGV